VKELESNYDIMHFEALGPEARHLEEEIKRAVGEKAIPEEHRYFITPKSVQEFLRDNPEATLPQIITTKTHSVLPGQYLDGSKKSVTVGAEVFPVGPVRRVVVMVSILVVYGEKAPVGMVELPAAPGTHEAVHFQRLLAVLIVLDMAFPGYLPDDIVNGPLDLFLYGPIRPVNRVSFAFHQCSL